MRLSESHDTNHAIAVIHAALDAGASLLDTADVYAPDEKHIGHNERLVAQALRSWPGDRSRVRTATKGGLRRTGGRWIADGRATHLRAACAASLEALQTECIDLYQLHAVDPRTSLETSVRALAALQEAGQVRTLGLCNVNVAQIKAARRIAEITAVQVSLSVWDDENLRNGVAEYCRDQGIQLLAYRPLGGERAARLARNPVLQTVAERHAVTAQEIALAWLIDLAPHIQPLPGATRVEHAAALEQVLSVRLTEADRAELDGYFPAGRLLRVARAQRRPPDTAPGDVVLVMGMPGAGKSSVAQEFCARGYERLNRDERGGSLADLVTALHDGVEKGKREWVLDNTYANRAARNQVIECAWQHGVPVRCVHLTTSIPDAQINAVTRLIEVHGRLPTPDELSTLGKKDARYFGPEAQFRYERQLEPPTSDEGFESIEERPFVRRRNPDLTERAVIFEYDGVLATSVAGNEAALDPDDVAVLPGLASVLERYRAEGSLLFAIAWRPQLAKGKITADDVEACFRQTRNLLGVHVEFAYCPHEAGPPVCWCRKPLPGLVLEFALHHNVALERSTMVGRAPLDRTLAERLGLAYHDHAEFFGKVY